MEKLELFDYQRAGVEFIKKHKFCYLADRPRLGKSAQAIVAADELNAVNLLVICKAVARRNWGNEFEKFSTRNREIFYVEGRLQAASAVKAKSKDQGKIIVVSYDLADVVLNTLMVGGGDFRFDYVVVDEAHSIKSLDAKRTKAILGKDGLVRKTKRMLLLSGTPAPNNASELWPMLFTFGATALKYDAFVQRFCKVRETGFGRQIYGTRTEPERLLELRGILAKVMLRRTEEDVDIELPKISYSTVMVPPGPVHLSSTIFHKYVIPFDRTEELNKLIEEELGIVNAILEKGYATDQLLAALKAESKSISTLRKYTALQKLEPACNLIGEELDAWAYQKVVIFGLHRDVIEGARLYLSRFAPVTLYGGTDPSRAQRNIRRFMDPRDKCRVFIGNIHAAGTSISLSAANHIFFLEEDWVPGNNAQAAMRCGGVNQTKPIFVRNFCLENSIDQRLQTLLVGKSTELALLYGNNSKPIGKVVIPPPPKPRGRPPGKPNKPKPEIEEPKVETPLPTSVDELF